MSGKVIEAMAYEKQGGSAAQTTSTSMAVFSLVLWMVCGYAMVREWLWSIDYLSLSFVN